MRVLSHTELQGAATGTSFYDDTVSATAQELIELIGPPTYDNNKGEDKVNLEWVVLKQILLKNIERSL